MQISLSLLLLICAGLFIRSLQNAQRLDPGFDPDQVMLGTYDLNGANYRTEQGNEFNRQLLSKLENEPGVVSATLADFSPLSFTIHTDDVLPDGYVPQPRESMEVSRAIVGPNYFRTMKTPVDRGRDISYGDTEESQPSPL